MSGAYSLKLSAAGKDSVVPLQMKINPEITLRVSHNRLNIDYAMNHVCGN
jgi:hypothetical protein